MEDGIYNGVGHGEFFLSSVCDRCAVAPRPPELVSQKGRTAQPRGFFLFKGTGLNPKSETDLATITQITQLQ